MARLRTMPPLVFAGECDELKDKIAAVVARRGLPAHGRRLRRDLRRRDRRQRPQQAARAAADGRRADLRRVGAGREGRPDRRPVRQAPLLRPRDPRGRHPAGLPRRRRQRLRLHRRVAGARPAAAGRRLQLLGRDPQPGPRLRHRRLRRPAPGAHLEHRLRPRVAGRPALRAGGRRDRAGADLHAGDRRRPRRVPPGRLPHLPRGAAARLRARDDPHRLAHRDAVRRLGALRLDRRAHPPARRRPRRAVPPHPQPDRRQARADHHAPTTRSRWPPS